MEWQEGGEKKIWDRVNREEDEERIREIVGRREKGRDKKVKRG